MMIRAALCYSLQPTFGQLQLSESLTKTFWYKYCPPWFKAVESYKSGPGKSQPLPFSPWPAHMKMAFLPLGLKTFYLKQLLFPWLLRRCEILFFSLWMCMILWRFGLHSKVHLKSLFVLCQGGMCVCIMYVHAHTHKYSDGCSNCMSWYTYEGQRTTLGVGPCHLPWLREDLQ